MAYLGTGLSGVCLSILSKIEDGAIFEYIESQIFNNNYTSMGDYLFSYYIDIFGINEDNLDIINISPSFERTICSIGKIRLDSGRDIKQEELSVLLNNSSFTNFYIERFFENNVKINENNIMELSDIINRFINNSQLMYKINCFIHNSNIVVTNGLSEIIQRDIWGKNLYLDYTLSKSGIEYDHQSIHGKLVYGLSLSPVSYSVHSFENEEDVVKIVQEKDYEDILISFKTILPLIKSKSLRCQILFSIIGREDFIDFDLSIFSTEELSECYYSIPPNLSLLNQISKNLKIVEKYVY